MFLKFRFLGVALATYVALGISACDEAKSFIVSASVEKPLVGNGSNILEVEIVVNGEKLTYKL